MSKKQHPLVRKLWTQLRALVSPINENDFNELLTVLEKWIRSHSRIFSKQDLYKYPALSLLLKGEIFQFHFVKKTAGANLKSLMNSDYCSPKMIQDMVERLEVIVREFALYTNWEDCPICQEGYLDYWKDLNINEILVCCPECGWQKYLHEERLDKQQLCLAILVPASKEDIKILNI